MTPSLVMFRDGKKFMWNGQVCGTREEALSTEELYRQDNFEVWTTEVEGRFCVYTRRVATQAAVTG